MTPSVIKPLETAVGFMPENIITSLPYSPSWVPTIGLNSRGPGRRSTSFQLTPSKAQVW